MLSIFAVSSYGRASESRFFSNGKMHLLLYYGNSNDSRSGRSDYRIKSWGLCTYWSTSESWDRPSQAMWLNQPERRRPVRHRYQPPWRCPPQTLAPPSRHGWTGFLLHPTPPLSEAASCNFFTIDPFRLISSAPKITHLESHSGRGVGGEDVGWSVIGNDKPVDWIQG
jgi:hypothetical protein